MGGSISKLAEDYLASQRATSSLLTSGHLVRTITLIQPIYHLHTTARAHFSPHQPCNTISAQVCDRLLNTLLQKQGGNCDLGHKCYVCDTIVKELKSVTLHWRFVDDGRQVRTRAERRVGKGGPWETAFTAVFWVVQESVREEGKEDGKGGFGESPEVVFGRDVCLELGYLKEGKGVGKCEVEAEGG